MLCKNCNVEMVIGKLWESNFGSSNFVIRYGNGLFGSNNYHFYPYICPKCLKIEWYIEPRFHDKNYKFEK